MASLFARSAVRAVSQTPRLAFPKASPANLRRAAPTPLRCRRFLATTSTPTPLASEQPRLRLGSEAPNFRAKTTQGEIDFHKWLGGSWAILFSHPADFTPVCTTELGAFARLAPEFARRGVKMIGLSANDLSSHERWITDINEVATGGGDHLRFPIIADADRRVAFLYDMLDAQDLENVDEKGIAFTIRSVFVIDPNRKIRLTMMYPASTGRNTAEVLRVIDSLQTGDKKGVTTPVDWNVGDDVIVPPTVSTEDARKKFGEVREVKPYLRYTKI
ncbi:mitochondrial peroxiredoxin PRX1 [Xylariaceae sp. FL0662B]|nr:mitochondrial peroxiredoxin PRX1 [Xylariaceae sp. FL0662B]